MAAKGAHRCTFCDYDWPLEEEYEKCPGCDLKTSEFANIKPMKKSVARKLAAHLRFERMYADWEETEPEEERFAEIDAHIEERYGHLAALYRAHDKEAIESAILSESETA